MDPPQWVPVPPTKPTGGAPETLILAGAVVGLAMMLMIVSSTLLNMAILSQWSGAERVPAAATGFLLGVMSFYVVFSSVGVLLAFRARRRLKRSEGREGRRQAIAGAVFMMVAMNIFGGILTLIGALMLEKPVPRARVVARFDRA